MRPSPPINYLERQAYIIGNPHGLIRPSENITRAEVATIFFRLISDEMRAYYWRQDNPFPDVTLNKWFNNAVSTTTNANIFTGLPDGTFAPNRHITRAEMATAIVRFMDVLGNTSTPANDHFTDIAGHWARNYINIAGENGWVNGPHGLGGIFNPNRPITPAETAAIINRIFGRLQECYTHLHEDMLAWPDNARRRAWYYLYVQSATNSYTFIWRGQDYIYEQWLSIIPARNWRVLERPYSRPEDIFTK